MSIRRFQILSLITIYLLFTQCISITGEDKPKIVRFVAIPILGQIGNDHYYKIKEIFKASSNNKFDGILILIDSNGGVFGPSAMISEAIIHATKCKPLVSFVSGNALSCGYWIAASAPYIIAAPLTLVGSIGYILNTNKYEKQPMFSSEEFKFTRFDSKGEILPEHNALMIELAAKGSATFRDQIVKLRPVLTHQSLIDLQAKYFTGDDSLKHKLVDQIGSMQDAAAELYRRAGSPNCDFVELLNLEEVVLARFTPQELLAN